MIVITDGQLGPMGNGFKRLYYKELHKTVKHEYETKRVFPEPDGILNALAFTPLADMETVIPGRDSHHNYGQARGLCSSVKPDASTPPSLVNIYQEPHDDLGCYIPNNGYLKKWVNQGVMLLDIVSTVKAHQANSYRDIGQEKFTDTAISILNQQDRLMVFILWGRPIQVKKAILNNPRYLILEAPRLSPLLASGGFFSSRPLSKTNAFLAEHGLAPVDWQIENV